MRAYVLTRDVTWPSLLGEDELGAHAGTVVYSFHRPTYGCVSPHGIAVSVTEGEYPFFEAPHDALEPLLHGIERPVS